MKKLSLFLILVCSIAFAADLPNIQDQPIRELQFNFKGQWMPSADPLQIGPENYRTLQNLRYTPVGTLESVGGYTKINTTVITGTPEVDAGFHFKKDNPAETHVLMRGDDGIIYQNTTAIPDAGDFSGTSLYTDASGAGDPRFSPAPYGHVAYANEVESTIWAGDEMPVAAFVTSSAQVTAGTLTHPKDHSMAVNNSMQTVEHAATVGATGGIDSYVNLMLHCDGVDAGTTFTDSSDTAHTMTAQADAQTDTDRLKFGTAGGLLDGVGDYISTTDHADFVITNTFTLDFWIYPTATQDHHIFTHYSDHTGASEDYYTFLIFNDGGTMKPRFEEWAAGANTQQYTATSGITLNAWNHVEFSCSAGTLYFFINGVAAGSDALAAPADQTENVWIGYNDKPGTYAVGSIDELRLSVGVARHTSGFTVSTSPYSIAESYWLVGASRPIQGVKFYVSSANTTASTMTVKEWTGSAWSALSVTDNTDTGASLAVTGTVTWTSTVDTSKVKFLESRLYYWYQFSIDAGNATIYRVTLDAPWQPIVDMWDGVYRQPIQFQAYKSANYEDYTLEVNDPDATYYGDLGGLLSTEWLIVMSDDRLTALKWVMVGGNENTTACTVSIYYWSGDGWASAGNITDTTLDEAGSTKSLAQSGVMSWEPPGIEDEFARTLFGTTGYAYKLVWSDTLLAANARVNTLYGVPAQLTVLPFKFPVTYKDRLFLCGYTEGGEGNRCDFSLTHAPQVFNGQESSAGYGPDGYPQSLYFGGDDELTAAIELYNRMGSNIFDFLVALKANETYVAYGDGPVFSYSMVSSTVGCPAPASLVTGEVAFSVSTEVERNIAMWVSYSGPILFDGAVLYKIPGLETYFDPNSDDYLGQRDIEGAIGFFDQTYGEYNIIVGSNWFAYNLRQKKWFSKDTGAAETPISAWPTRDIYGNQYVYAGRDDGFVVRLEYGTSWGGTGIVQQVRTGDFFPTKSMWDMTEIRRIKIAYKRISDGSSLAVYHYGDGATSGATSFSTSLGTGLHRLARMTEPVNILGWVHGFLFESTLVSEKKGFQPLGWAIEFLDRRKDH